MSAAASPVSPGLDRVAVLERDIGASIERVWENVLDWEHLPWLHREDFASIEVQDAGAWGWRADLTSTGTPDEHFVVELLIESEALRYVSRTVSGRGAGTEIWTFLSPRGDAATGIRVEFWLPDVPEAARRKVGEGYVRLYQRLWDEDESMMQERTGRLAEARRPAPGDVVDLGPRAELALPACVPVGGALWRIVELEGALVVHDAVCPHMLGPLTGEGAPVENDGEVECPWHGYRFDVRTGRSSDGRRLRLRTPPRIEHDAATDRVSLRLD